VAYFLEKGTRPHPIYARGGGFLRFVSNGAVVFRRMVNHPGTAPRPFMREARDLAEAAAHPLAEKFINGAIQSARG
jgi:hypothetical protein